MASGPAPFSDIGKKARDLLTKDYNFGHKFTLTTLSNAGLGITATGVKLDELFLGDIGTQYKIGRTTVHVKVNTNSIVSTTVTLNELVSGMKTSLLFKIPDQKSGKLDVHYLNDHATVRSSVGLTPAPLLEFSAAVGTKELSIGGEVGFDSASASFTKYNAGIGLNKPDFSASLLLFEELIPECKQSSLPRQRSQKATVKRKKTKKNKALSSSSGRRKSEHVFQPEPDSNKDVSSTKNRRDWDRIV